MHRPSWRSPTIPPIRSVWLACSMRQLGHRRGSRPRPTSFAGARVGRTQPGSRPAPLWRRRDPGRGAARAALVGDALSVRSRADNHAVAIQRAVGSTGSSQPRHGRRPRPNPRIRVSSPVRNRSPSAGRAGRQTIQFNARKDGFEHRCRRRCRPAGGWRQKMAGSSTIAIDA